MKLVSCYVENFGGLSRYSVRFEDGLTVIREDNGFGKTTLAEFIRAMFYGFPRAAKTLEKNPRKKYTPWQGGRFGGNLVFEHQGKRYRIERSFGDAPRQDTFALYDEDTQRKSTDFSENIGVELFQLDGESFERSTYMPQQQETGALTTAGIQAKLGDLVEDTNDINNYDKAVQALRNKRSALLPYRGSGGSIQEAQRNISQLQEELAKDSQVYARLEEGKAELQQLKDDISRTNTALAAVREEMTRSSQAKAKGTLDDQYRTLRQAREESTGRLRAMEEKYPRGVPSEEDVEEVLPMFDKALQLIGDDTPTRAELDAQRLAQAHAERFASGIPGEQELAACQASCGEYLTLKSKLESTALTPGELARYEALAAFFAPGIPEEAQLEQYREKQREREQLLNRLSSCGLRAEDGERLAELRAFFSGGVPTGEEMSRYQEDLAKLHALRQENLTLSAVPAAPEPQEKPSKAFLPVLLAGLAALIAGAVLMVLKLYAAGGICLGLGAAALIGAVYLRLKQMLGAALAAPRQGISRQTREKLAQNEQEAAALEQALEDFTGAYIPSDRPVGEKLSEIAGKQKALAELEAAASRHEEERRSLTAQLGEATAWLHDRLDGYFGGSEDFDGCIVTLQLKRQQFMDLSREKAEAEDACRELNDRMEKAADQIAGFLTPYCGAVIPEGFQPALTALRRTADDYSRAQIILSDRARRLEAREAELSRCRDTAAAFAGRYGLTLELSDRAAIRRIRDDARAYAGLVTQAEEARRDAEEFYQSNRQILDAPAPGDVRGLEEINAEENALAARMDDLGQAYLRQQQLLRQLQEQADAIPGKEDELEAWLEKKAAGQKQCDLLDKTMEFLEKAKENLSDNYLAPIRRSFVGYLQSLTLEPAQGIFLSGEMDVRMERLGQGRELGYFSAGQRDAVLLCMRLALIDGLFKEAKPFLILDDPFVNLDDAHTLRALRMLKELSKNHQIIYLVCNSSRTPE